MLDLSETFVYDAACHAYNFHPSNYRLERYAKGQVGLLLNATLSASPEGYRLPEEELKKDWQPAELASMLFAESNTDMATHQPLPIYAFADGFCSVDKVAETKRRWPDRFTTYATVDPLQGEDAIRNLEEQVERLDPVGVKLYPLSWREDGFVRWNFDDDSEAAFAVVERARELGVDLIAIHKALPPGPVPRDTYDPRDVSVAASAFDDVDFSIVHGGFAFAEETAWQLGGFDNIHVNLEALGVQLVGNPSAFERNLATMLQIGGAHAIDQIHWGSTTTAFHPQVQLEAFRDFEFSEETLDEGTALGPLSQLTDEDKRKILGLNYADLVGVDVDEARRRHEGDEFDRTLTAEGLQAPYSTTASAEEAY
jgi:hypothetical protein